VAARRTAASALNRRPTRPTPAIHLIETEPVLAAAQEAGNHGVTRSGWSLPGADWTRVRAGRNSPARGPQGKRKGAPGCSLGIIKTSRSRSSQGSGLECYNHNLESSERFSLKFARLTPMVSGLQQSSISNRQVSRFVQGYFGMGETRQDRCELAFL